MPPMELQRRHSVNPVRGTQGGVSGSSRGRGDPPASGRAPVARSGRPNWSETQEALRIFTTRAECRKQVIHRVVELGDHERGPEPTVGFRAAPELWNPPGYWDAEDRLDLRPGQFGRALVARAHHRELHATDVAPAGGG